MSASILAPTRFSPLELDRYLALGWRPLGQRIYTADFIQLSLGDICGVTPTRLPLQTHAWRKGQRKLLRKNETQFELRYGPAKITAEKQRVHQLYRQVHPSKSQQELDVHTEHNGRQIFSTREICIYHQGKLVAFSFYDIGETSAYSKVGIYDPSYQNASLGLYTMYLEINWCQAHGFDFYYPGYVSSDSPLFDYKRRLGELQFRDLASRNWLLLKDYQAAQHGPLQQLDHRLQALGQLLDQFGLHYQRYTYLFFEMPLMYAEAQHYVDTPAMLLLHCPQARTCWVVIFDIQLQLFQCWETVFEQAITFFDTSAQHQNYFRYVLQKDRLLCHAETHIGIADELRYLLHGKSINLVPLEH